MFRGGVPDLLLVGPVTWDRFGGERRAGGAVSYGARAASAMGVHAGILTSGADDAPLDAFDGHELHRVPAERTRVFIHEPRAGRERRLRVAETNQGVEETDQRAGMRLSAADLPPGWAEAPVALLAPLLPTQLDMSSFHTLSAGRVGLLAQGLQRRVAGGAGARVLPQQHLHDTERTRVVAAFGGLVGLRHELPGALLVDVDFAQLVDRQLTPGGAFAE